MRKHQEDPCWLVGETPDGLQIVEARLVGPPLEGSQVVRVGFGCGILHTIPAEKVCLSRADAEKRLAELTS